MRVNSIEWVTDIGYRESLERMQIDLNEHTLYSIQCTGYSMQCTVHIEFLEMGFVSGWKTRLD